MNVERPQVTAFRAPLYIAWEITHRCNAKCLHCYSGSRPDASVENDLKTEDALTLIDQLADAGLMVLAFSGGEPMLRKDWPVLLERAVKRGLCVNIGTNGTSITEEVADQLQGIGISSVTISLDSHRPEVHDEFRQYPGLFPKTTRAISRLVSRGIRVVVGFTPTRLNWEDGKSVIDLACELGADAVNLSEYVPAGRGSIELALSPPELREVLSSWARWRQDYSGRISIIWHDCRVGMLVSEEEKRNYVGCGAGRLVARILPDGTFTPCVFLPTPIGKFPEESFNSMWAKSRLLQRFRERQEISGNCGECEHLSTCGGCRAVAYAYSGGNPFAGDPHCWVSTGVAPVSLGDGERLPV